MASNYWKVKKGLNFEPVATAVSAAGDVAYNSSASTLEYYNGAVRTVVNTAETQTLTNKTLSGNTATNLISGSGTLTLNTTGTITVPNATDTLVGKATTDTLTNKSISTGGTNTIGATTISGVTGTTNLVMSASPTLTGTLTTATITASGVVTSNLAGQAVIASASNSGASETIKIENTNAAAGSNAQLLLTNDSLHNFRIQQYSSGGTGGANLTNGLTGEICQMFTDSSNSGISIGTNSIAAINIDNLQSVGIGTPGPGTTLHVSGTGVWSDFYGTQGEFIARRANGSRTSPTAIQAGDNISNFGTRGYGATAFAGSSTTSMRGWANQTFTDSAMGTYATFTTTPNGATVGLERVRINAGGNVSIGNTNDTYKLEVTGTTNLNGAITGTSSLVLGTTSGTRGTISLVGTSGSSPKFTFDNTAATGGKTWISGDGLTIANGTFEITSTDTSNVTIFQSSRTATTLPLATSLSSTLNVAGQITNTFLTASQAIFTDGSKNLVSNAITGTGNVVMSASPTLTGTITASAATFSGTLNNSVLTASQAIFTDGSKNFVSNAITGTGNVVMSASPTLTGTVSAAAITATGTLTIGSAGLSIHRGTGSFTAAGSSGTATKVISPVGSNGWGIFYINDVSSGDHIASVVFAAASNTLIITNLAATEFVTGAPSSSQTQLTYDNTTGTLTVTNGFAGTRTYQIIVLGY